MANEKRLIDANELIRIVRSQANKDPVSYPIVSATLNAVANLADGLEIVDAVEVVHGRWVLTAHEEYANYRWKVTAECSECHHDKGEVYADFISGFPTDIARDIVLEHAESVKLDNYCPNCGARMTDGDGNG